MSKKSRGINGERQVIHLFWGANKWGAVRVAGSGAIKYPVPDILASSGLRTLAIECKITNDDSVYISRKEIDDLRFFGKLFRAESWVAVHFSRQEWLFFNIEDLRETEESFTINRERSTRAGITFNELIALGQ